MPALGVSSHLTTGAANQLCQSMNEPGRHHQEQFSDACLCDKFYLTEASLYVLVHIVDKLDWLYMIRSAKYTSVL